MKLRLLFTLFLGYFACAQGIFENSITGTNPSTLNPYTIGQIVDPNITVSGVGRGTGINAAIANDRYSANNWNSGSLNAVKYFEFTLTPNVGYEINFISFVYNGQASGTGATSFAFRSSIDGYTTNIGTPTVAGTTINLTAGTFQNITGSITFRFYGWGASASTGTFSINDFVFNGTVVSACSSPADPSGTIAVTPDCGSSSLAYSLPSATTYWQTSATGISTAFPTTSPYVVTTDGTYFVRTFNGSCWSTGAVSQSVTIVNPVVISVEPSNQSTTVSATATFTVNATNATSYQWQESTNGGGTWSNVGTNSSSYTIASATLALNGYQYRVLVSGTAPCSSVTSTIATLTVTTGPCLSQPTFTMLPSGWLENTISYSAGEAVFAGNNGDLTTPSVSNPTSLTFDLRRTSNTSPKDLIVEVSTTTQTGVFTAITTYNIGNTVSDGTTLCTVNLSSYTSFSTVYIRFRKASSTASPWYIQNVNVYCGTPPSGPEINVTGNGLTIADGDTTPSSTDNTNFGSTLIGTNIVQTFVIQNIGTTDLTLSLPITLSDVSLPQEFTITQPTSSTIAPGSSVFFTVRFNSAVAGLFTNAINIVNSDTDEALYNFDIVAIASTTAAGGTVFNPGDLIFTGYDGQINGSGAEDEYLVATLVDILPGTVFSIVNSRYEAGAGAGVRTNKWGGGGDDPSEAPYQADITYNGSTTIPAGSVLQIITNGSANWFGTINVIIGTVSTNQTTDFSGNVVGGTFLTPNISTSSPDQMYLVQGNFISDGIIDLNQANYYLSGTLLHGLTNRIAWVPLVNACSGSSATNTSNPRESRLPAALTCFNVESISSSAVSGYYENDKEHGLASIYQIINAVADVANNWTLGTSRYTLDPSSSATTRAGKTFLIGPSNPSGQWVGGVDTNWFNCANWSGLVVPDSNTNVIVNTTATNVASIDYTAAYSDDYSDIAVCKDLSISGSKVEIFSSSNNVLEVFGDVLITTSGILDMDDSNNSTADGQIILHGNWTNAIDNTAFEEGNGTVVFKGITDQIISAVVPEGTEVFYDVILNNDFTTSISNDIIATGNLVVETGKLLTINANNYIQVNNDLTVNGSLNVLNNGSIIQVNDLGINSGNISYERVTSGNTFDYVYWSSPVEGFSTPSSGNIFSWSTTATNTNGGLGYWTYALGTTMEPGVGYIMRDIFSRTFNNGIARNGIITTSIERGSYTGGDYLGTNGITITNLDDNLNLLGNPYPSSINAIDFLTANTNIEGAVRIWTHGTSPSTSIPNPFYGSYQSNYSINDYIIYNSTGSSTGPSVFNGYIAGGQGFFTIMNDGTASTQNVVFTNAMRSRTYDNSQFYRSAVASNTSENDKNRIWLELINSNNQSAKTLIGYVNGATMGKDRMYDAVALPSTRTSIYSIVDSKSMAIQGRFPFNIDDTVHLGVKITNSGINSIGVFAVDGLFQEQDIYLEDLYLNVIHDIRATAYTFTAPIGEYENRFILRFKTPLLSNTDFNLNENVVQVYSDQFIHVKSLTDVNIKSIQVFDLLARKVFEKSKINKASYIISYLIQNQVALFVKIELENNTIITKKIIY